MTITEFLAARLDEDEAAVNDRTRRLAPDGHALLEQFGDFGDDERWMIEIPAGRVTREIEAKRNIVQDHTGSHECPTEDSECGYWSGDDGCRVTRFLATVYADHPDYREEWRP